ncbi:SPOR domain-containing protein [bacterium]|nr:SPOR domain-containing protein [bacterium]
MRSTIFFHRNINFMMLVFLLLFGVLSSCESSSESEKTSPEQEIVVQTEWKPDNSIGKEEQEADTSNLQNTPSKQKENNDPFFDNPEIYTIQVGSFIDRSNAEKLLKYLTNKGYSSKIAVTKSKEKQWNIVRIGPFSTKSTAVMTANKISKVEKLDAIIFFNNKIIQNVSTKRNSLKKTENTRVPLKNTPRNVNQIKSDKNAKFSFQVGGLHIQSVAMKHTASLLTKGYPAFTFKEKGKTDNDVWYSVRIGYFKTIVDAVNAAAKFTAIEDIPAQARPVSD